MVLRRPSARSCVVVVALRLASAYKAVARVLVEPRADSGRFVDAGSVPLHSRLRAACLVVVLAIGAEARSGDTERPRKACRRSGHCNRSYQCLQFPHNASHGHFASRSELVSAWIDRCKRTSFRLTFHLPDGDAQVAERRVRWRRASENATPGTCQAATRGFAKKIKDVPFAGFYPQPGTRPWGARAPRYAHGAGSRTKNPLWAGLPASPATAKPSNGRANGNML